MADINSILGAAQADQKAKADAWEVANGAKDQNDFTTRLGSINIPQEVKAQLWEAKYAAAPVATVPGAEQTGLPPAPKPPIPPVLSAPKSRYEQLQEVAAPQNEAIRQKINQDIEPYKEVGRGAAQVFTDPTVEGKAKGASRAIRGGMEAGAPVAAFLAPANPVATAVGLGAGTLAGKATGAALRKAGVPEGYADLGEDVAGIAAGGMAAKKLTAPKINPTAAQVERASARFSSDPADLMVRGMKPKASNIGFRESLERSLPEVKAAEAQTGTKTENVDSLIANTKAAKARIWDQYMQIMGPKAKAQYDASPIADAILATIDDRTAVQNPARASQIRQTAETYRRPMAIQQMEDYLHRVNAELDSYHDKNPRARYVDAAKNPDTAALVAEGNSLRARIYGALDEAGEGAAPAELKKRYGSLLNLEEEAYRRKNVADRQQPESLSQQVGKVRAYGHIARGLFTGNPADAAMGAAEIAGSNWLKERQTTDAMIRRAFEGVKNTPAPINTPAPFQPKALIGTGDIAPPAPPDTSYVRSVPGVPVSGKKPLALPPPGQPQQDYTNLDLGSQFGDVLGSRLLRRPPILPPPSSR